MSLIIIFLYPKQNFNESKFNYSKINNLYEKLFTLMSLYHVKGITYMKIKENQKQMKQKKKKNEFV